MQKKNLVLFTNKFPFVGGEPFLETEIVYLANSFDKVRIFSLESGTEKSIALPENVIIMPFEFNKDVKLKKIVLQHFYILLRWFGSEFVLSKHRWKYISQFRWNFFRLIGLIDAADRLLNEYKEILKNSNNYSYWFNEWASVLAISKAMDKDISFISRVHLYDFEEEFQSRGYLPFRNIESKHVKAIYPISDYAMRYLSNKYQNKRIKETQRLGVNDNGLNLLNKETNEITIVSCSYLLWFKRPLLIARLIEKLNLDVTWHHFGDGPLKTEFLNLAGTLPSNVKFIHHGHVSNSVVIEFYRLNHVTLLINLSSFEGIPVSMMEAISFGIPIIGCDVCGMPEIVTDETGLLLEENVNLTDAAEKVREFISKKADNLDFRKGVRDFWMSKYNSKINYTNFINKIKA